MPWRNTDLKRERTAFVGDYTDGEQNISALARRYGVSRPTAYKWLERYRKEGVFGLDDRSQAAREHPNALSREMEEEILKLKARWPRWGAPKLWEKLRRQVEEDCPSESSIGRVLQRNGLTRGRGRRRPRAQGTALSQGGQANALWCADFKGWFMTADGAKCTPLTISDQHSRYLLRCQGLGGATGSAIVRPLFEATFREFGLPTALRTDNGAPFASVGLGGLTEFSVWLLRLGIRLERSRPGCPQDNGRHERMHRTLKDATAKPPAANQRAQQALFDAFLREYNQERPHEALGGKSPSEVYEPSLREFPERLPAPREYPDEWERRKVRGGGQIKWEGRDIVVSQALKGEQIGLEPKSDGIWHVYFEHCLLGEFDQRTAGVRPLPKGKSAAANNQPANS